MKNTIVKRAIATIAFLAIIAVLGIAAGINAVNTAETITVRGFRMDVETSFKGSVIATGIHEVTADGDVYIENTDIITGMRVDSGDTVCNLIDINASTRLQAALERLAHLNARAYDIQSATSIQSGNMAKAMAAHKSLYETILKAQTEGVSYEKYNASVENSISCWALLASSQLNSDKGFNESELEAAQKEVTKLQLKAQAHKLYSPVSGVVIEANTNTGSNANQGDVLFKIADELQIVAYGDIETGTAVKEGDSALIIDKTNSVMSKVKKITRNNNRITIMLDAAAASEYKSEVDIIVISHDAKHVLLVPVESVLYDADETYVYVMENQKLFKRTVKTGAKIDGDIEILSGLNQGETIILNPAKLPFEALFKLWSEIKQNRSKD